VIWLDFEFVDFGATQEIGAQVGFVGGQGAEVIDLKEHSAVAAVTRNQLRAFGLRLVHDLAEAHSGFLKLPAGHRVLLSRTHQSVGVLGGNFNPGRWVKSKKHPSGAKAHNQNGRFAARLKSCPFKTNPN
jgi:hypothetical protein